MSSATQLILTQGTFRSAGEANLGASLGGTGVFKDKTGVTLNFKGVNVTGGLLTITALTNTVDLGLSPGSPSTLKTNLAGVDGSSSDVVREDHVHPIEVAEQEVISGSTTAPFTATAYTILETKTPGAGTYLVIAGMRVNGNASTDESAFISIFQNGTQQTGSERKLRLPIVASGPSDGFLETHAIVTLGGGKAVDLRWKTAAGIAITGGERALTLIQLKV